MNKSKKILVAVSSAFISLSSISAPEVSGKVTYEAANYYEHGTTNGAASSHGRDQFKAETSARIYIDGALEDEKGSTYHIELQAFDDSDAVPSMDDNKSYTQRDALREAYIDTSSGNTLIRAGKQQVVWGTADGMKLLDTINPTDFSEMAQNQMEDSRIPVWMINTETTLPDGGNFQVIVSEPRENIFSGLNRNIDTSSRSNAAPSSLTYTGDVAGTGTDRGNPFVLMGPDSITGVTNGFTNIVPDLGTVAHLFGMAFDDQGVMDGGGLDPDDHGAMNYFTVGSFNTGTKLRDFDQSYYGMADSLTPYGSSFNDLNFGTTAFWTYADTFDGQNTLGAFGAMFGTNLHNTTAETDSVFEYMSRTPFSTFDAFVGAKSQYVYNMPDASDMDVHLRYKNTTDSGVNYSFNYSNAYDKNPIINLSWRNSAGTELKTCRNTVAGMSSYKYLTLENLSTSCSGSNSGAYGGSAGDYATLRFTQEVKRTNNIGGSFDMTLENEQLGPIVLRGEAVYQQGTYSPVMDKGALDIGDLTKALTMRKGDRFKYVLGADVTLLTNMMVSAQFIEDRNLDYIDQNVDWDGSTACTSNTLNCGVYTTDYATMHLSNGFNKAEENKRFYSLYLSKPYGESGQHRWNNITIVEDTGGYWNRLDTEYTVDDNTILTGEINSYWGEKNSQFGQLKDASNVQLGVKYIF